MTTKVKGRQLDVTDVALEISTDATGIGHLATGLTTDASAIATLDAEYARVDNTNGNGFLPLTGGTLTGNLQVLNSAANSVVIIDCVDGVGSPQLLMQRDNVAEADVFSISNRLLVRRYHSAAGTNTNLELYDDLVQVNKEMRGVATTAGSNTLAFTTKGFVDGNFLSLAGGTLTGDLDIDAAGQAVRLQLHADSDQTPLIEWFKGTNEKLQLTAYDTSASMVFYNDGGTVGSSLTLRNGSIAFTSAVEVDGNLIVDRTGTTPIIGSQIANVWSTQLLGYAENTVLRNFNSSGVATNNLNLHNNYALFDTVVRGEDPVNIQDFTTKSYVDGLDTNNVKLTGNQTVAGNKTFANGDSVLFDGTVTSNEAFIFLNREMRTSATVRANTPNSTALVWRSYVDDNFVDLTNNQTIAGVKTFTSSPVVPVPVNATDAASKDYVDGHIERSGDFMTDLLSFRLQTTTGPSENGVEFRNNGEAAQPGVKYGGVVGVQTTGTNQHVSLFKSIGAVLSTEIKLDDTSVTIDADTVDFPNAGTITISDTAPVIYLKAGSAQSGTLEFQANDIRSANIEAASADLTIRHFDTADGTTEKSAFQLTTDIKTYRSGVQHSRFGSSGIANQIEIYPQNPSANSTSELVLNTRTSGGSTFAIRIASSSTLTESYTVVMPTNKPTAGQVMRVASVSGQFVNMEWYTP